MIRGLVILGGVGAIVTAWPATPFAQELPRCPAFVESTQTVHAPGTVVWQADAFTGTQRFTRMTFKLASDRGELKPDEDKVVGKQRLLVYDVEGLEGLQQVCQYAGTQATMFRPVPGKVTKCEIVLAGTGPAAAAVSATCR